MVWFTLVAHAAETTSAGGISALGLDVRAFIFDVINFAILLLILRFIAYKPIVSVLDARRQKIEESLKNAEAVDRLKKEMEEEQHKILHEARTKAQEIIAASQAESKEVLAKAETKAQQRSEEILKQAEQRIAQEMHAAQTALKHETIGLVIAATEKIMNEKLDAKKDEALLKRALEKVR